MTEPSDAFARRIMDQIAARPKLTPRQRAQAIIDATPASKKPRSFFDVMFDLAPVTPRKPRPRKPKGPTFMLGPKNDRPVREYTADTWDGRTVTVRACDLGDGTVLFNQLHDDVRLGTIAELEVLP